MKKIYNLIFLLLFASSLQATEWGNNLALESSLAEEGKITDILVDQAQNRFSVSYSGELGEATMARVLQLKDRLFSLNNLKISTLNFVVSEKMIEIVLLPEKLNYLDQNIAESFPAGMTFFYTGELHYDFRMMKDNIFMRIKGRFIDEAELDKKIFRAYSNPEDYIKSTDINYVADKLEQIDNDLERLREAYLTNQNRGTPIARQTINEIVSAKKEHPDWSKKELAEYFKSQKIKISDSEIALVLQVYFGEYNR